MDDKPRCRYCGAVLRRYGRYWATADPNNDHPWHCDSPDALGRYHRPAEAPAPRRTAAATWRAAGRLRAGRRIERSAASGASCRSAGP